MATPHNIVVLVGSIRKESFTLKIANALAKLAPDTLKLDVVSLHGISFFNQDLETTPPADWLAFREKIQKSAGVLFVTPEYNRSIPGVLKNAIDVASRPYGKSSFLGKPIGIVSNSPGPLGGVSAAKHLQNILPGISGPILGQPEIYLNLIGDAFDEKGEIGKEAVQKLLHQYIVAFTASLLPRFRQTMLASSVSIQPGRTAGGGTNVFAKPTSRREGLADSRRNFVWRPSARSGRPIGSAHWCAAHEAVDPAGRERPTVDWSANIPHPHPVFYCGSHRYRRHSWLAVIR
jgi:chromate reductase